TNEWPRQLAEDVLFNHGGAEFVHDEISQDGIYARWRTPAESIWIDSFDGTNPDSNELGGSSEFSDLEAVERSTYRPESDSPTGRYRKAISLHLKSDDSGRYTTWMAEDRTPITV